MSEGLLAHLKKLFENAGINDIPECDDDYMKTLRDGVNEAVLGVAQQIKDIDMDITPDVEWSNDYYGGFLAGSDWTKKKVLALLGVEK